MQNKWRNHIIKKNHIISFKKNGNNLYVNLKTHFFQKLILSLFVPLQIIQLSSETSVYIFYIFWVITMWKLKWDILYTHTCISARACVCACMRDIYIFF